ncbi:hypothetical protein EC988_001851, partial [Linderina pennispora]
MSSQPKDYMADSLSTQEKLAGGETTAYYDDIDSNLKNRETIEPPADMTKAIAGKLSIWTLLVVIMELCERFAYYGASLMFSIYLQTKLDRSKSQSVALNRVNQFMSYATTVLGAIIADQWLGKFKTIVLFALLYFIGL